MRGIFGFIAFVVVIIFLIIFIFRIGRSPEISAPPRPALVTAAESDASFSLISSGPIVADENFYQVRINVSRAGRSVQVIRGYNSQVIASKHFDNNTEAFSQFLSAIDRAGYTTQRRTNVETEAGVCPNGRRHVFESDQFGEDFRRWISSCRETGNFGGAFSTIQQLFQSQIPEYREFITETRRETGLGLRL